MAYQFREILFNFVQVARRVACLPWPTDRQAAGRDSNPAPIRLGWMVRGKLTFYSRFSLPRTKIWIKAV